jgi:outer membrane cobalamin receptor
MEYEWYSYVVAERMKGGLTARGPLGENVQVAAGGEAFEDRGSVTDLSPEWDYFSGGAGTVRNRQFAVFVQAFYTRGSTVPSIGLRYDRHNLFGAEFLPWIGVTRILGKWSLKALFGQTFRAPSLENLDLNPQIKPEKTTTGELEIGYQASDNLYFIADFFETRIKGPIVYFYDTSTDEESYGNYRKVGSRGVEFESRWKADWGYLNASYSFYKPVDMIDSYRIEGKPGFFLGFSNHKASLSGHFKFGRGGLSLNPTLAFYGRRYGYTGLDADSMAVIGEFKPSLLANCCVQSDRPFGLPVEASLGVYNA